MGPPGAVRPARARPVSRAENRPFQTPISATTPPRGSRLRSSSCAVFLFRRLSRTVADATSGRSAASPMRSDPGDLCRCGCSRGPVPEPLGRMRRARGTKFSSGCSLHAASACRSGGLHRADDAQTINRVVSGSLPQAYRLGIWSSTLPYFACARPATSASAWVRGAVYRLVALEPPSYRVSRHLRRPISRRAMSGALRRAPDSGVSPCSTDLSRAERAKNSSGLRRTTTSPGLRPTTPSSPSGDASTAASRLMPFSSHQRSSQASMSGRTVIHRSHRVQH